MTPAERMAIVLALRDLAGHFEFLKAEATRQNSRPIYTGEDMWARGADMLKRTAVDYENGWTPSYDVALFEDYEGPRP